MENKICKVCGIDKPLKDYHKDKECSFGVKARCKNCIANYNKQKYPEVSKSRLNQKKEYYLKNRQSILEKGKTYRDTNKSKMAETRKHWTSRNKDKRRAHVAMRRARKKKATPPWLTTSQKQTIFLYYSLAVKLSKINSQDYHVDHIVPLQGENVCGLHVPWNLQVIPATENLSKSNKHTYQ